MGYKVPFSAKVASEIRKLDKSTKIILEKTDDKHLSECENPRSSGK